MARTAVLSDVKYTDLSGSTVVPCLNATMTVDFGIPQTTSLAIVGEVSSGTPAMTRDAGALGSGASSGMLLPTAANDFRVASLSAVAGLQTKLSTVVLCCSALLFANSKASKSPQASPASAASYGT